MKERLSIERFNTQINNTLNEAESPSEIRESAKKIPLQTDKTGTAYRIRPQTPRINLL